MDNPLSNIKNLPKQYWVLVIGGGAILGLYLRNRRNVNSGDTNVDTSITDSTDQSTAQLDYQQGGANLLPSYEPSPVGYGDTTVPTSGSLVYPQYPEYPVYPTVGVSTDSPDASLTPPDAPTAPSVTVLIPGAAELTAALGTLSNAGQSSPAVRNETPAKTRTVNGKKQYFWAGKWHTVPAPADKDTTYVTTPTKSPAAHVKTRQVKGKTQYWWGNKWHTVPNPKQTA